MSNRTVPAAAEGMPKPWNDLETPICDAVDFAKVANFVAVHIIGDVSRTEHTKLLPWEAEMVLFTALQAKVAAERAQAIYYALPGSAR